MPETMTTTEFKNRYRMSSGWPEVQAEHENREAAEQEAKRSAEMLEAGAKIKRGPGRPPKVEADVQENEA